MNRRGFLGFLAAVPVTVKAAPVLRALAAGPARGFVTIPGSAIVAGTIDAATMAANAITAAKITVGADPLFASDNGPSRK
jgi:hypothetical protein